MPCTDRYVDMILAGDYMKAKQNQCGTNEHINESGVSTKPTYHKQCEQFEWRKIASPPRYLYCLYLQLQCMHNFQPHLLVLQNFNCSF